MAIDKHINSHIDKQEKIINKAHEDVEKLLNDIDVELLMDDTEGVLLDIIEAFKEHIIDKYFEDAIKNGMDFAKLIETYKDKNKDFIIDDSKNPKQNEGVVDATSEKTK